MVSVNICCFTCVIQSYYNFTWTPMEVFNTNNKTLVKICKWLCILTDYLRNLLSRICGASIFSRKHVNLILSKNFSGTKNCKCCKFVHSITMEVLTRNLLSYFLSYHVVWCSRHVVIFGTTSACQLMGHDNNMNTDIHMNRFNERIIKYSTA